MTTANSSMTCELLIVGVTEMNQHSRPMYTHCAYSSCEWLYLVPPVLETQKEAVRLYISQFLH